MLDGWWGHRHHSAASFNLVTGIWCNLVSSSKLPVDVVSSCSPTESEIELKVGGWYFKMWPTIDLGPNTNDMYVFSCPPTTCALFLGKTRLWDTSLQFTVISLRVVIETRNVFEMVQWWILLAKASLLYPQQPDDRWTLIISWRSLLILFSQIY